MVKYVLVERGNPGNRAAPKKWYAQHKSSGEMTLRQLAKDLSNGSTVNMPDVMAVLESLLQRLPELLSQGMIVRLGDFGSFSGSLNSAGAATKEEFNAGADITGFNVKFRPGKELTKATAQVDYQRVAVEPVP